MVSGLALPFAKQGSKVAGKQPGLSLVREAGTQKNKLCGVAGFWFSARAGAAVVRGAVLVIAAVFLTCTAAEPKALAQFLNLFLRQNAGSFSGLVAENFGSAELRVRFYKLTG